jgi:hypothetical protein
MLLDIKERTSVPVEDSEKTALLIDDVTILVVPLAADGMRYPDLHITRRQAERFESHESFSGPSDAKICNMTVNL